MTKLAYLTTVDIILIIINDIVISSSHISNGLFTCKLRDETVVISTKNQEIWNKKFFTRKTIPIKNVGLECYISATKSVHILLFVLYKQPSILSI